MKDKIAFKILSIQVLAKTLLSKALMLLVKKRTVKLTINKKKKL